LGRTLKKDKHLQKSIGMDVEVKTYKPVNGSKEFEGTLQAFDAESVTLETEDAEELVLLRSDIATIRLAFDF